MATVEYYAFFYAEGEGATGSSLYTIGLEVVWLDGFSGCEVGIQVLWEKASPWCQNDVADIEFVR